jgi:mono/diheme cytochrome c family protein
MDARRAITGLMRARSFVRHFCVVAMVACTPDQTPAARLPSPPTSTPAVLVAGDSLFASHCQQCHGQQALGTDRGPPLVHTIYAPGHHADVAFHLAARNGVRAHHWTYGNMPPIPALSESQTTEIISYIRWLQREAGIN